MLTTADIERYFTGEKQESILFMLIGLLSVAGGLVALFILKTAFWKGLAIPCMAIGVLLGIVGWTVYARSDNDRIRNVYAYSMNPDQLKQEEVPRMELVMKNFRLYRYIEITVLIVGLLMAVWGFNSGKQQLLGWGCGLMLMAVIALTADYFAERRGAGYLEGLKSFTVIR